MHTALKRKGLGGASLGALPDASVRREEEGGVFGGFVGSTGAATAEICDRQPETSTAAQTTLCSSLSRFVLGRTDTQGHNTRDDDLAGVVVSTPSSRGPGYEGRDSFQLPQSSPKTLARVSSVNLAEGVEAAAASSHGLFSVQLRRLSHADRLWSGSPVAGVGEGMA